MNSNDLVILELSEGLGHRLNRSSNGLPDDRCFELPGKQHQGIHTLRGLSQHGGYFGQFFS